MRAVVFGLGLLLAGCDRDVLTVTGAGGASSSASHVVSSSDASTGAIGTTSPASSVASTGAGGAAPISEMLKGGPWLIGWTGDLDHYSWVRFDFVDDHQGSFMVRDPIEAGGPMTPFFGCQGQGLFSVDEAQNDVLLQLPSDCNQTVHLWIFEFTAPEGLFPQAILGAHAGIDTMQTLITPAKFDTGFCKPDFSACANPYAQ